MERSKEYYAFISYKSEDVEWAIWLQHELEHYHLPASFNGRTDIRQELRPVFRDIDELAAGNLPEQIRRALENSQNLIVVCSPQAAASPWVNKEVETFISLGRTDRIFPFVVEGNAPKDFFPPALLALPKNEERLGGDASKQGRDIAFVKVVAGMLGLGFESLWNRYEKEKAEQERKNREQRNKLMTAHGRFIGSKAMSYINNGDSYLAQTAIKEMFDSGQGITTPEVEAALRKAMQYKSSIIHSDAIAKCITVCPVKELMAIMSDTNEELQGARYYRKIDIWNYRICKLITTIYQRGNIGKACLHFSSDGTYIYATHGYGFDVYDVGSGELLNGWHWEKPKITKYQPRMFGFDVSSNEDVAIVGINLGIHIIDLHKMREVRTIDESCLPNFSDRRLCYIALSPDANIVVCSFHSGGVWLCNLKNNQYVKLSSDDSSFIKFSNDGEKILLVPRKGEMELRCTNDFHKSIKLNCSAPLIHNALFSHDDNKIIYSERMPKDTEIERTTISIYDLTTGRTKVIISHKGEISDIGIDPNNVLYALDDKTIRILCVSDKDYHEVATANSKITHMGYSLDGKNIVCAVQKQNYLPTYIQIRDAMSLECKEELNIRDIGHLRIMTIDRRLDSIHLSDMSYKTCYIHKKEDKWYYQNGREEGHPLDHYMGTVFGVDEEYLLWYNEDYGEDMKRNVFVTVMSIAQQKEIGIITDVLCYDHQYYNQWVTDSSGRFLAIKKIGGNISIYRLSDCRRVEDLGTCIEDRAYLFTIDGEYFVGLKGNVILVWETTEWIQRREISIDLSSDDVISQIGCSRDNKYLIIALFSGSIRIFDIATGFHVYSFETNKQIISLKFNPQFDSFAILFVDGSLSLFLWDDLPSIIMKTSERVKDRELTKKERDLFYL